MWCPQGILPALVYIIKVGHQARPLALSSFCYLPFKVDLHDDFGEISRIFKDCITLEFLSSATCCCIICDCQAGSHGVKMILDRPIEVIESVMMLHQPVRQRTLLFMVVH